MDWLVSVVTIIGMVLLTQKKVAGFYVNLIAQALWLVIIIRTGEWGLLTLTVALTLTYIHGIFKWKRG